MKTTFFILLVLWSIGMNAQDLITDGLKTSLSPSYYQKGNILLSGIPMGGFTLGNRQSGNGISLGQSVKIGYFVTNKLSLTLGSYQMLKYHHYIFSDMSEGVFKDALSSVSISMRYYFLNKRFTPYADLGFEHFSGYKTSNLFEASNAGFYFSGAAFAGIGLNIPLGNFNINLSGKYMLQLYKSDNVFGYDPILSSGWRPEFGISYIFNKNRFKKTENYHFE
jgi:hypothetical protein